MTRARQASWLTEAEKRKAALDAAMWKLLQVPGDHFLTAVTALNAFSDALKVHYLEKAAEMVENSGPDDCRKLLASRIRELGR